jgi:N-acetylglucosaminyl-diphospho-decaprenol L-rhamnosyltransferase
VKDIFQEVTIICVTFNSATCVDSLARDFSNYANVVFVDNGSRDTTVELLRARLPQAQIIENKHNLGFGAANNIGLARVTTSWALLINPDCEIDTSALSELIAVSENYANAALIAPQAVDVDGSLQECYGPAFFRAQPRGYRPADAVTGAEWLSGCCLLLRMSCFQDRRAFDERFFLYYEDDDLALDVRRRGHECLIVPHVSVKHFGNASSGRDWRTQLFKDFHYQRSKRLIVSKYLGSIAELKHRLKLLVAGFVAIPLYAILFRRKYLIRWLGWFGSALVR